MSREKDNATSTRDILLCGAKGLAAGVIAAAALLFILTGIAYCTRDPGALAEPFGIAALLLSSAIAGVTASRVSREEGVVSAVCGGSAGLMMLVLLLFMNLLPAEAANVAPSSLSRGLLYAAVPVSSALLGFILRKKKRKRPLRKRRR